MPGRDGEGNRDWLMLCPIPCETENNGATEIDQETIKGEASLAPKEGESVSIRGKDLRWKKISAKDYYFDVNELLGSTIENSIGYFVVWVDAPEEMKDVVLKMGSNDQGRAYLNGKEAVKFSETRTIDKDSDSSKPLTLNKGKNHLVFKVINEGNNFQGCIRFTKGDKPITNLKISLEK